MTESPSNRCAIGPSSSSRSSNVAAARSPPPPPPENPGAREWVGVAFRMAGELSRGARGNPRSARGAAGLTRVPGAKTWVKGIANVRGQLLPILDLRQYLGPA